MYDVIKIQKIYLWTRYSEQIYYYSKALEQVTEKKVTEKYIYSFCLGKVIAVNMD